MDETLGLQTTTKSWPPAAEMAESPNPPLEIIRINGEVSLLRLSDLDGRPLFFPSFRISTNPPKWAENTEAQKPLYGFHGTRSEVMEDVAQPGMYMEGHLDTLQKERLLYALDNLKLPSLLAVHAALNTDLDLTKFPMPDRLQPDPITFSMNGRPSTGKSLMTAVYSLRNDFPILVFDSVSESTAQTYVEYIHDHISEYGLSEDDLNNLSVEKMWEFVWQVKEAVGENKYRTPKTFRRMLDNALTLVASSPQRSSLYLCDMPGWPGEYDYGTGKIHGVKRKHHIIDLAAGESCENGVTSTHQLLDPTFERKLRWIAEEVVEPNIDKWRDMRKSFISSVRKLVGRRT